MLPRQVRKRCGRPRPLAARCGADPVGRTASHCGGKSVKNRARHAHTFSSGQLPESQTHAMDGAFYVCGLCAP
jgi:hypothetical protein